MKKSLLVIALGLALTACGSGGSSSGGGKTAEKTEPPKTITKSIDLVPEHLREKVAEKKIVEIQDNGKVIKLDIANENVGFVRKNLKDGYVYGYNQPYSVFGAWLPYDVKVDNDGVVIDNRVDSDNFDVYGLLTEKDQMPVSGSAVYNGVSRGAIISGKLRLDVNFGEKTTSGKLYDRKKDSGQSLDDIILHKGSISIGHQDIRNKEAVVFSGQASYKGVQGIYVGSFFGPNAEEVSGAVGNDDAGIYEAFAGKK